MISGDSLCFLLGAFLLLALPLDWVLSMVAAALVHELCHIFSVMVLRGKIRRIRIAFGGCLYGRRRIALFCGEFHAI